MNGQVFQSANEHMGIGVRTAPDDVVANQHQGIVSSLYPGNSKP